MIMKSEDCTLTDLQQLGTAPQNIQNGLNLIPHLIIDGSSLERPHRQSLFLKDFRSGIMKFDALALGQPLVILSPCQLNGLLSRLVDGQLGKIRLIFRFGESILEFWLIRIIDFFGISVPLGLVPGHLHVKVGIDVGIHNSERFAKSLYIGIVLDLNVIFVEGGRDNGIVSGFIVNDVGVLGVDDGPFIDGIGAAEDGIVHEFDAFFVDGYGGDVFEFRVEDVGIVVALRGVEFVFEATL
mmetsp:Transcript_15668/g.22950  ORF Transcript_15668/g.22950 Transcript_15668/m.22950 type:complete len:240 (-) Transcript_15668:396-1115(-)